MDELVFKILLPIEWDEFQTTGVFHGSSIDTRDGFIHLSTRSQAITTAAKYFAGISPIVLVAVRTKNFGDLIRFEESRGGELFPHLYGSIYFRDIALSQPVAIGHGGVHLFPDRIWAPDC